MTYGGWAQWKRRRKKAEKAGRTPIVSTQCREAFSLTCALEECEEWEECDREVTAWAEVHFGSDHEEASDVESMFATAAR